MSFLGMDMSKFKLESHVAQQSRRDKLRVHHLGLNPDLVQVRSVRNANLLYDPTFVSPHQELTEDEESCSREMPANGSCKVPGDPQSCGDWVMGYGINQNPMFDAAMGYPKPNYSEICSQDSKRHCGELHFVSSSLYDVVTTASLGTQGLEMASMTHQASALQCGNGGGAWTNIRPVLEDGQQWADAATNTTQGLSLTLSSNTTCGAAQFTDDQFCSHRFKESQDSKALNTAHLYSMQKPSIISKGSGNSTCVPLGPFTGYATILKNSKFLKPAEQLLDQYCHIANSKLAKVCETSDAVIGDIGDLASADDANAVDMEDRAIKGNNSGASISSFCSSNEISVAVGIGSSSSCRPEYQQKKAKLLYLQEEVCRRYKLYYQQMQMVVSSFESVAGLSSATPYVSLALKTVEKNFRCIKNAISDRVRHICRALGEDLLSSTTGASSSKGDINMSRLKYEVQKSGGVNVGFLEPQQQGWRPQRGLPERAVAILRAWLFEHFLHPYPTDTDKHMLATQTGLSRNQVSNWFINARVRVWKPMVEEIHMLESKGLAENNPNSSKTTEAKSPSTNRPNEDQRIDRPCINATSMEQLTCSGTAVAGTTGDAHDTERWFHDKPLRMDFRIPTSMEGSLLSFAPYEQSRLEMGGLGAVSLTLGLRHGVETAQAHQHQHRHRQQQYQSQEDQLQRPFGGQMVHDFVG
ncbi:hypothetical protein ERO13_A03G031800v2 [Gossypium hirsutum]|uniref:BEL1-like homeodomain protein 8 isoform X1 n=1 Tax=Gossypium hirsutum TaxID=3635 RepID=A0A1U8PXN7_GOSHI|nr:BEL1-like homeodomain protein 8 isoform X1 [Gossypium hirsutum]XP_016755908.1 BEL1-like homeodomain protein 8 isoform X1 [Gossypium hirsutum]XP_016755909.1 BEL1-like homeodomain protein 8 isoform X1 [Gossypium hirsutum]XP_016755910.1 BEL1-like homeodomain protein 8 isoform X1 [Gossypium hirsutum]XP_040962774.1 BEL1-like homeodomain protein 8 isoform X1 [Gossypium hirsutum]KAG4206850.1 hypothetical protein ERO13_A03G031800v2 [Gossypium hirsutum]KAG4206851.1 hypothetical protein ERO13_A03G03